MNFVSLDFFWLFAITLTAHFLAPFRFRWLVLLAASCIFYGAFIPAYLLVLFLVILIDYFAALRIHASAHKRTWLVASIVANVILLGIFKYYNFFAAEFGGLTGTRLPLLELALPIGLSFHTFQSLSYTIEVYRGRVVPERNLGIYSLYVMFFPQLVAGPIERPYHLLPQFRTRRPFSMANLYTGLQWMALGFFKKLVIADRLSDYVDAAYRYPDMLNGTQAALALLFFSIQIYADFSGYTDIARGTAKTLGYDLSLNFNLPYLSANIAEFWTRWHISLSGWFRDYVYIPLGGNRKGLFITARNILVTFALSGLWHGAGTHFILWGLVHGLMVAAYLVFDRTAPRFRLPRALAIAITFIAVTVSWTLFRGKDPGSSVRILAALGNFSAGTLPDWKLPVVTPTLYGNYSIAFTMAGFILTILLDRLALKAPETRKAPFHWMVFALVILLCIFFAVINRKSFIYFQF